MVYYLCEFEYGYSGQFYQVSENGYVVNYVDLSGNTIILEGSYGYFLVYSEPVIPPFIITTPESEI